MNQTRLPFALGQQTRAWLLTAMMAILISALFVPSENAAESGVDLPRVILTLALGGVAAFVYRAESIRVSPNIRSTAFWVDVSVLGFLVLHTFSCLAGIFGQTAEPGPALNLLWQQVTMGVIYFLGRGLIRSSQDLSQVMISLVAAGLVVSVFAWYQYAVALPSLHASYLNAEESEKLSMLAEAGVTETAPDSRMRQLFESRLFNREPFAFFTLANSLGGLLVPLVLISFCQGWKFLGKRNFSEGALWGGAWLLLSSVLVLTSSRTAVLAITFMMVVWAMLWWWKSQGSRRWNAWLPWLVVALPTLAVIGLWLAGASDSRLLSSAPASVRYRLEYWLSSAEMIADHPWLGVHPGSFQANYAKYQLPTASETISDPHNFLVEWLATSGIPAGLSMLLAIVLAFVYSWQRQAEAAREESQVAAPDAVFLWSPLIGILVGGIVGWVSCWLFGFVADAPNAWMGDVVVVVAVVMATVWGVSLTRSMNQGAGTATHADWLTLKLAWLGLMVHLAASGGINYPALGQLFFLLLASVVNQSIVSAGYPATKSKTVLTPASGPQSIGLAVLGSGLLLVAGGLYWFRLSAVVQADALMSRAEVSMQRGNADLAARQLTQVLKKNPFDSQAAFLRASAALIQRLPELTDPQVMDEVDAGFRSALQLEPASAPARVAVAQQYLNLLDPIEAMPETQRTKLRQSLLQKADEWLLQAEERKPVDAKILVLRSWVNWAMGENSTSRRLAEAAASLDAVFRHDDLKLAGQRLPLDRYSAAQLAESGVVVDGESSTPRLQADRWVQWVLEGNLAANRSE